MQPVIQPGDFVQVQGAPFYLPGDIVAVDASPDPWTCHRFLGFVRYRGAWWILTRSDSSRLPDRLTPVDRLLGKVVGINHKPNTISWAQRARSTGGWVTCMAGLGHKWLARGLWRPGRHPEGRYFEEK